MRHAFPPGIRLASFPHTLKLNVKSSIPWTVTDMRGKAVAVILAENIRQANAVRETLEPQVPNCQLRKSEPAEMAFVAAKLVREHRRVPRQQVFWL